MTSTYKKQVVVVVDSGGFKVRHGGNGAPSRLGGEVLHADIPTVVLLDVSGASLQQFRLSS
jgi:hypothetical protein